MFLQRQPSQWSCVPTAFAMLFDMDVKELIKEIGHDGSEVFWPELEPTQLGKRAFHPQECVDIGLKRGLRIVAIHVLPYTEHYVSHIEPKAIWSEQYCIDRLTSYLACYEGVLTGTTNFNLGHAVAWNREKIYDPRGWVKVLQEANFNPQVFYMKT